VDERIRPGRDRTPPRTPPGDTPWPRRSERERLDQERREQERRDLERRDRERRERREQERRERARVRAADGRPPVPPRRRPAEPPPVEDPTRPVGPRVRAAHDRARRDRDEPVTRITRPAVPRRPVDDVDDVDDLRTRPVRQSPPSATPPKAPLPGAGAAGAAKPKTGSPRTGTPRTGTPGAGVPRTSRTGPSKAGPSKAGPTTTGPTKTGPAKTGPTTSGPTTPAGGGTASTSTPARAVAASAAAEADEPATARPERTSGTRRPTPPPVRRTGRRRPRTLGRALLTTAAATVAPGSGHLMLHRRRTGWLILGPFLFLVVALLLLLTTQRRSTLLTPLLSSSGLGLATAGCVLAAVAWIAVIARTWVISQPRGLDSSRKTVGVAVVTALCLLVAAPFGFAANLANSSRSVLGELFTDDAGSAAALGPRVNLLLVGSDAGPDRTGTRTDTMMVASIDTASGRTTLFSLPRNIAYAQFPPGSPMAEEFPDGFHDSAGPSGNYYLNAVYAYGHEFPALAPTTPTDDPGLNLLHQTVSYMLGLDLDYYVELNMAGFAAIIDSLGGVRVDVGPERIPIGGISPTGRAVTPTGYIEPGVQQLGGEDALAFARSRTNSTDYVRMGRQRCLIQNILDQNQPAELLTNFQSIARATTDSVSTDIPQQALPALLSVADAPIQLESVAFDPNLPDPEQSDGRFNTGDPDFDLMKQVVQDAINRDPAATPPTVAAAPSAIPEANEADEDSQTGDSGAEATTDAPLTSTPVSVAQSC
jgi:LCP family protein required for cell wall assembly